MTAPAFASVESHQGEIICNLCIDTCDKLKEIAETKGIDAVETYLNTLCDSVAGFLGKVCDSVVKFGMDELLKLIENHVKSDEICQTIKLC